MPLENVHCIVWWGSLVLIPLQIAMIETENTNHGNSVIGTTIMIMVLFIQSELIKYVTHEHIRMNAAQIRETINTLAVTPAETKVPVETKAAAPVETKAPIETKTVVPTKINTVTAETKASAIIPSSYDLMKTARSLKKSAHESFNQELGKAAPDVNVLRMWKAAQDAAVQAEHSIRYVRTAWNNRPTGL